MGIKGITDRELQRDAAAGRTVSLGTLGKGTRTGFGKNAKLKDLPYFVYKPVNGDERLTAIFAKVYGNEPERIPDIRLPVSQAGNFQIKDCCWLTASKHTEAGGIFLARSDGESILQSRNPSTGKVSFHQVGQRPYSESTRIDGDGRECFVYGGNLYPWQRTMAIDLILPDFNRELFKQRIIGHGVVTFINHSLNDITTMIDEYYGILNELVSLFANPLRDDRQFWLERLPLRKFQLELTRVPRPTTVPNYHKEAGTADRIKVKKSLVHWGLAPGLAAAIQESLDKQTGLLLDTIANLPLLNTPSRVAIANSTLGLDDSQALPAGEPVATNGIDWESLMTMNGDSEDEEIQAVEGVVVDAETGEILEDAPVEEEQVRPGKDPDPVDWQGAAVKAQNLDALALAIYQLNRPAGVFTDAVAVKKAIKHICGSDIEEDANGHVATAVGVYVRTIADGGLVAAAKAAAKAKYQELVNAQGELFPE